MSVFWRFFQKPFLPDAQTALKSFTYNCLDLEIKQYISDNKMIKVLRNIKEKCLILKPDKGQGIVLIDKTDYYNSMERLFNDTSKFTFLQKDPTLQNLSTVQTYLNTFHFLIYLLMSPLSAKKNIYTMQLLTTLKL